jgi:2-polyprenyl-3-methyl-5-hydroxy-6-metoxy-1,4-benzoquinol methylase
MSIEPGKDGAPATTVEVVAALQKDKDLYAQASAKEAAHWGKVFSNERRNAALVEDQQAAAKLRLHRHAMHLPDVLRKHGLTPQSGLSLACGGGRAERGLLAQGICTRFHGIDIADDALATAQRVATEQNLPITYERGDLNALQLQPSAYDLVVTQNCLHHVLELERLRDQIHLSLRPGGLLWVHDYVGETQFQYDEDRLRLINEVLAILPARYRADKVNQRTLATVVRPSPGLLPSPFEAIRSAEILPVLLERFDILDKYESDTLIGMTVPTGTRGNFLETEDGVVIFELLHMIDRVLLDHGILTPRAGMYLLTPKAT